MQGLCSTRVIGPGKVGRQGLILGGSGQCTSRPKLLGELWVLSACGSIPGCRPRIESTKGLSFPDAQCAVDILTLIASVLSCPR